MSYEKETIEELINQIHFSFVVRKIVLALLLLMTGIFLLIYKSEIAYILGSVVVCFIWIFLVFIFDPLLKRQKSEKDLEKVNFFYILLEFSLLVVSTYYAGGISGTGPLFLILPLIYAHNYLSRKRAFLATFFSIALILGLVFFEFFGIFPHRQNFYFDLFGNQKYVLVTTVIFCSFLLFLSWTLSIFINMLRERNNAVLKLYKESEDIKDSLEIKVGARKKELGELARALEMQIKEKKKELQKRVWELKEINRQTIDRELKMVKIKKALKN